MSQQSLKELLLTRLASGLKRKTITKASIWAETYRRMGGTRPGPWSFKHFPWLKDMHDSLSEINVGQKGAQLGFTETVLNLVFFNIDIKGYDCLYVLPSKTPDASDFSAARFDPALELSPHLSSLFTDVKNVGHKRSGSANLYVRGSQSRSGLKSIPAALLIMDEIEEFHEGAIELAFERSSGQLEKQAWLISTPTIDDVGINKHYNQSTKEHFYFKCPCCSRKTELIFPDCLEITSDDINSQEIKNSFLKCKECQGKLEHKEKHIWLADNEWVPEYSDRTIRGFHVNQLYSSTVKPHEIATSYLKSLSNPADDQEFHNSKLGVTRIVEGARVNDSDIERCKRNHRNYEPATFGINTLGVDIGKWIHYEVDQWLIPRNPITNDLNLESTVKVVRFGKFLHFEELDKLMHEYRIMSCVIDANPETRKALEFAYRFSGLVHLCYYGKGVKGKNISKVEDTTDPKITVDRTSWLDLSLGRFRNTTILLPLDINIEYADHIKALVRIYEKDKDGNPVGRYENGTRADHFAHARNYAEIALPFALSRGEHQVIRDKL